MAEANVRADILGVWPRERAVRYPHRVIGLLLAGAFAAVLSLTMLAPMMMEATLSPESGNLLRQVLYCGAAALALVGLRPHAQPRLILSVWWPVTLVLLYCTLSLSWAIAPDVGAKRLFFTALIVWTIFTTVRNVGYERALLVLQLVLGTTVFANIATAVLLPQYGVHMANNELDKNLIGDWCGFMVQKNHTAAATAFAAIVFAFGGGRLPAPVRAGVLLAAMFLLYKTGSRTSMGMCLGALIIGACYLAYSARFRVPLLVTLIIGLTAASNAIGFFQFDNFFNTRNRELLSGRTEIWEPMINYVRDSGYMGAGYGSFWDIGPSSPIFRYGQGWVTSLGQGHNGYLDLLTTIGALGLVIAIAATLVLPIALLLSSRGAEGTRGAMLLAIIVFCAGHNGTETSLLDRDGIAEVLLMVALAMLTLLLESRGRAGDPPVRIKPSQWLGLTPREVLVSAAADPRFRTDAPARQQDVKAEQRRLNER